MSISKNKGLFFISMCIIIIVYNVIAFVLPFGRSGIFWTGYGFSMVAIFLVTGVGFYVLGHDSMRSKVYGCSLFFVIGCYFIIQLIIGLLEMAFAFIPFKYGIALNVILLGGCLIGLFATDIGIEEIERIDEKIKEKVFYIKLLQAELEGMVDKSTDETTKKVLNEIVEAIRYSDPMSNPQLVSIENKIEAKIAGLADMVDTSSFATINFACDEVKQLIIERNRKCKMLK